MNGVLSLTNQLLGYAISELWISKYRDHSSYLD
jgi:hypothetical protein